MAYLGSFRIDDYVPIVATCHRFSTGAAYAPTSLTYSIYEEGNAVGIDENVDMVVASPFDSIVGCYYVRRQLTAAAGFEVKKTYVVVIKATVDSVAAIQIDTFQIEAAVDLSSVATLAQIEAGVAATMNISLRKNTAFPNFCFVMRDSTNHNPATGKTITAERSIDGGAFAACANVPVELGATGHYKLLLAATDLNGDAIELRLTCAACDEIGVFIRTQS